MTPSAQLVDVGEWSYRDSVVVPGSGLVSLWAHSTGATHLHGWQVPGDAAFGLTFRTESGDDRGAAHVLEHLVGTGSRKYHSTCALYMSMFRTMSDFLNGFTETGRTSYTFVSADVTDYAVILDVLLDAVYFPALGEREFLREAARHIHPGESGREGVISGVVFHEMWLKREREDEWISRLLTRHTSPRSFAQYRHEGTPDAVARLTYEECLDYHERWYRPANAHSFSSGDVLPAVLRALDAAHHACAAGKRIADSPGGPVAPLSGPHRLRDMRWTALRIGLPGGTLTDWLSALRLAGAYAATGAKPRPDVLGPPALVDGRPALWCALRGGEPHKIDRLWPVAGGEPRHTSPEALAAHLGARYRDLPAELRWGLALAPLRVAGVDQIAFWGSGDQDPPPEGPLDIRVVELTGRGDDVSSAWSADRAAEDDRVWRTTTRSDDESLPLRRLGERGGCGLEAMEIRSAGLSYLLRPGEDRRYRHLELPVREQALSLLHPLGEILRRRDGVPADPLGPCAVRTDEENRPVVDLVVPIGGGVQDELLPADLAPALAKAAALWRRQLAAAVITRPADIARRICLGSLSAAGRAVDLLNGHAAAVNLGNALADEDRLRAGIESLRELVGAAGVSLVIVGEEPPGVSVRSGRLPDAPSVEAVPPDIPDGLLRSGVTCAAWDASGIPDGDWPALLVAAGHVHRFLHHNVRELGGAYAVGAQADVLIKTMCVWSQADPAPRRTLDLYRTLWAGALREMSRDDLETAKLIAVRTERGRRKTLTYLSGVARSSPSLNHDFAGLVDKVDLESLRRVAAEIATSRWQALGWPRNADRAVLL
ncbi:insulinase family protein [Actinomadura sp. DC4]|uniref:insulinase family protein n=1 Tax=Actinomadura sp. DC4 TaxID=3055069 RepID=UPI0025AFFB99|nr:insulinase family protein [Actinomadura sp. DC4]MDN3354468.1 insulinase family protein [Actinomadura sp. DC4]